MTNTRNCIVNDHNVKNNDAGSAPPPPTLEHMLAMQAQMLQTMINI
jgi:hypothetical protein